MKRSNQVAHHAIAVEIRLGISSDWSLVGEKWQSQPARSRMHLTKRADNRLIAAEQAALEQFECPHKDSIAIISRLKNRDRQRYGCMDRRSYLVGIWCGQ